MNAAFVSGAACLLLVACSEDNRPLRTRFQIGPIGGHADGYRVSAGDKEDMVEWHVTRQGRVLRRWHKRGRTPIGEWATWYQDGKRASLGSFDDGGKWSFWDAEGGLLCAAVYSTVSEQLDYTCFDGDARISKRELQERRRSECLEVGAHFPSGDPRCPGQFW